MTRQGGTSPGRLACLRSAGGFFPLAGRSRFRVTGSDRLRYINGQISCNVSSLPPFQARPGCILTPKGKLCAHVFIWADSDTFVLDLPSAAAEELAARLEKYIISDDVAVEPIPPAARYHVFGANPPTELTGVPRLGCPGFDTEIRPDGPCEATAAEIALLRIERGLPEWGSELSNEILPQEAGLDQSSVDFHKGCYVGQEVVSRLRSVGHVNKHLTGFAGTLADSPDKTLLLHPLKDPTASAGTITSRAKHFELAQTAALGYLNRQFEASERFLVTDRNGTPLGEVTKQPFPFITT